ncbi:MAG: hypothetical protein OXH70_17790 [Acidobacteria bacterium]|nr:hypothetical protein [Acidobacteriota bacterium]
MNPLSQLLVPYESEEIQGHEFFFRYISDPEQTELAEFIHGLPEVDDDDHTTRASHAKAIARKCVVTSVRLKEENADNVKPDLSEDEANILLLRMAKRERCGVTRSTLAEMAMEACGWGRVSEEEVDEAKDGAKDSGDGSDEKKGVEDPLASTAPSEKSSTT